MFRPVGVQWGIRQREVEDNPQELVHIMLFKYSESIPLEDNLIKMQTAHQLAVQSIDRLI